MTLKFRAAVANVIRQCLSRFSCISNLKFGHSPRKYRVGPIIAVPIDVGNVRLIISSRIGKMICKRKHRKEHRVTLRRITRDLVLHHPRAVVLYGSMAGFLNEPGFDRVPNDIDLLVVCNNLLTAVESIDYGIPLELHRFRMDEIINIAKTLRYASKPVALSKLYSKQTVKQHARDVIAACLLLGPGYRDFGIEQIEIEGLTDKRDYSIHEVLFGKEWWNRLQAYARERRGPLKRFSDMAVLRYDFDA